MFKLKDKLMNGDGMGGGGMGGNTGGMGGGNGACYIYSNEQATQTADLKAAKPSEAQAIFNRTVYMNGRMRMDGPNGAGDTNGASVTIWGFYDPTAAAGSGMGRGDTPFPSPAMRLTAGDVAHTVLNIGMGMWKHTVHHHGIEPEYRSDGVGHTSFDVADSYTYQWQPKHAGTYFYHCHVNTVLHAEMGMYGALIVDPTINTATTKYANEDPTSQYDVEAIWAVDEIDSNWHVNAMDWDMGTCGESINVTLNQLVPDYFIITGVDGTKGVKGSAYVSDAVAATVEQGQKLLIRYINAGYLPQMVKLPAGMDGDIIASDGRPLPAAKTMIGGQTMLNTVSAERYEIIITVSNNQALGDYPVVFEIQDWITGEALGTATTRITVTAPAA